MSVGERAPRSGELFLGELEALRALDIEASDMSSYATHLEASLMESLHDGVRIAGDTSIATHITMAQAEDVRVRAEAERKRLDGIYLGQLVGVHVVDTSAVSAIIKHEFTDKNIVTSNPVPEMGFRTPWKPVNKDVVGTVRYVFPDGSFRLDRPMTKLSRLAMVPTLVLGGTADMRSNYRVNPFSEDGETVVAVTLF